MAKAGKWDFIIYQGGDFQKVLTWYDGDEDAVDISDYEFYLTIKERPEDTTAILTLSTANEIVIEPLEQGTMVITIDSDVTEDLDFTVAYYDLFYIDGDGKKNPLLRGSVELIKKNLE